MRIAYIKSRFALKSALRYCRDYFSLLHTAISLVGRGGDPAIPFPRTVEELLNEILRKEKQEQRPKPKNKRLRAVLTRSIDGEEVNAKEVVFDWLAQELQQRDPQEKRTVVVIMDGENKLRDLQEVKLKRAIGILDIWHVTEYLYELAYCFHREGSKEPNEGWGSVMRFCSWTPLLRTTQGSWVRPMYVDHRPAA